MTRYGLLLLAVPMLSLTAAQAPATTDVPITLTSYSISPKVIHLNAGVPVRLRFTNASSKGHDFSAPGFFNRSTTMAETVPDGEVELAGRASKTIELVPSRGTYKAWCSHFGHKLLGMSATIIVD